MSDQFLYRCGDPWWSYDSPDVGLQILAFAHSNRGGEHPLAWDQLVADACATFLREPSSTHALILAGVMIKAFAFCPSCRQLRYARPRPVEQIAAALGESTTIALLRRLRGVQDQWSMDDNGLASCDGQPVSELALAALRKALAQFRWLCASRIITGDPTGRYASTTARLLGVPWIGRNSLMGFSLGPHRN